MCPRAGTSTSYRCYVSLEASAIQYPTFLKNHVLIDDQTRCQPLKTPHPIPERSCTQSLTHQDIQFLFLVGEYSNSSKLRGVQFRLDPHLEALVLEPF